MLISHQKLQIAGAKVVRLNINSIEKKIENEVHRGDHVKFWDDVWCLKVPLRVYFPRLYNINTDRRRASVKEMYADGKWNLGFRRNLNEGELDELKEMLATVSLVVSPDKIVWPFGKAGMYTARPMYRLITFGGIIDRDAGDVEE